MAPTGTFDVDINAPEDPVLVEHKRGGSQDSSLELSDTMVQERGRVGRFGAITGLPNEQISNWILTRRHDITTFSITILSIMTLSINALDTECFHAECQLC